MNNFRLLLIVVCLFLTSFVKGQEKNSKKYPIEFDWQKELAKKGTKTIEDYFLLLPSEFLDCEGIYNGYSSIEKREKLIAKKDIRNGYIQFHKTAQISLFKDRVNLKDIIAVQIGRCGAGNTCGSLNTILEFIGNKWILRVDLLPDHKTIADIYHELEKEDICPYFNLPQIGTIIDVRDEYSGAVIMKYNWTGQKFQVIAE